MSISFYHILGIVLSIVLIEVVGVVSSKKVKTADDFNRAGGRAGTWVVCGTIMGTLIGGQSTVGTAQLAFSYGISAWWFTLGAALGCVFLAIGYVIPLRKSGCTTLLEVVSKEYGKKAEVLGSLLCSLGMFVSIVAQILSASALLMTLFPMKFYLAAAISCLIMMIYVVFGGLWSAGIGGIVKLILLCISTLAGGIIVLSLTDGYHGLMTAIEEMIGTLVEPYGRVSQENIQERYNNLFARGAAKDVGSCLSVILGVLATQSYAQGIWAAKTDSVARKGAMISAVLTIPIGAACVLIGLYMRGHYVTAEEMEALAVVGKTLPDNIGVMTTTAQAFPLFITHMMPEFLGGIVLGTLLITIIIGGSGLTLGSSTILVRDVFMKINPSLRDSSKNLKVSRLTIVVILLMSVFVAATFSGSFINDLGFLSMGLRATAVFIPLTLALFLPKRFKYQWIIISIIAGTVALFISQMLLSIDGIFVGLGVALVCCLLGFRYTS
ncbi:MAG: sodium:solute symporter family protein [Lentimicrobiaceae bacterium]|nr:sodium:solute symporter family protein [Lentimicrobiaceae bacterium]